MFDGGSLDEPAELQSVTRAQQDRLQVKYRNSPDSSVQRAGSMPRPADGLQRHPNGRRREEREERGRDENERKTTRGGAS